MAARRALHFVSLYPRTAPDMPVQPLVFLLFLVVSAGLVVIW